ncbi:MAG: branched-chain amino acid ABC transporter permease [Chloroflexota bacterium]|nr:MAG: branched-chain amino acid ABC transporter permease [Chloroflexota bacterium]
MNFENVIQSLMFGLFTGAIYGIAAVGLSLVFGVLKVLNVAHGELLMLGGYISYFAFAAWGLDPFLSLLIVIPAMILAGIVLDRVLFRHIVRQEGEEKIKNSLLVSFGLALIMQNLAITQFTADDRSIQVAYMGMGINLLGISLPYSRLGSLILALVVILALHFFLHHSLAGKAVLATAEDVEAAELAGINIHRVFMLTFAVGASLAAIAGTQVVLTYGISPSVGLYWTLKALIIVILAGTNSILGAFPAGLLLGVVEGLSGAFLGQTYSEVIGLVMFLLVLMLRPQGLFVRQ